MKSIYKFIFAFFICFANISVADTNGTLDTVNYVQTIDRRVFPVKRGIIAASSNGSNQLVAAVTGKSICVIAVSYVTAGAVSVSFRSASTAISGVYAWLANQGISIPREPSCIYTTVAGEALNMFLSGAVSVGGDFRYIEIP